MDLKLPKLGEGADSGIVVNVFVKEGDTVAKDQAIIELENEKAVASIPATDGGGGAFPQDVDPAVSSSAFILARRASSTAYSASSIAAYA